ncbi:MAG: nucleotide exchange factor GrpE [bacterium]
MEVKDNVGPASAEVDNMSKEEKERLKSNRAGRNSQKRRAPQSAKMKKLQQQILQLQQERDELKDRLLRKAAEFDNFKKRTENQNVQLAATANADLIAQLLPVIDDLERSIASAGENEDFKGLLAGVELISRNFCKVLEKRGVKRIVAVGEAFDPEKHDALMQVDSDEHPPGIVVDEHLKGYEFNGRVLRHSQVLVSK